MDNLQINTKSNLLRRQIKKHLANVSYEEFDKLSKFIESIDMEYADIKEDRASLERTLDISSTELLNKNKKSEKLLYKNIKINEKLEDSRFHLKTIVNSIGEGLVVINSDKEIIMANYKASILSGYLIKDLVGKQYDDCVNFLVENKRLEKYIFSTLENNKEYAFYKGAVLKGKNKEIPIFITLSPLKKYYGKEKKTACVVIFRDATKQKELEILKNDFLSIASHELRTPMTVIRGYVGLFISGKFGEVTINQRVYLEKIKKNIKNLIDLVNDMLDINKLEAGKMDFFYEKIDLKKLLEDTVEEMRELYLKKNISLNCNAIEGIIINSDYKKIRQVLINFLSNSYKFTSKDGEVTADLIISNDDKIIISVTDNGIGIAKDNLEKLFQKFTQVGSHLNKTEQGTGLGLSLSKQIVTGLGGKIWAESVYREGSKFFFSLPNK